MNKSTFALVGSLMLGASGFALAQVTPVPAPAIERPGQVQTQKLIGTNIKNARDETIGEIKSVVLAADGAVDAVVVSVGGILGVGDREVAINWKDLTITDGGNVVRANMTKEQLAALPEYKYLSTADRGTVFRPSPDRARVTPPATTAQVTPPTLREPVPSTERPGQIQTNKLIGTNITNGQDQTVGEIKSVVLGTDGSVEAVVVGVGGFLGVGEREVAIGWKDLTIANGGTIVKVNMTKEQLAALPAYQYANTADRGTVFRSARDGAPLTTAQRPVDARPSAMQPAPIPRTGDLATLPSGFVTASKLVGLNVYDTDNKAVGEIKDVVLSSRGEVQRAILNVGGIMGIGSKDVGVNWGDIQFRSDGDALKAVVAMSVDQLKAMPEYRSDRGAWVLKN